MISEDINRPRYDYFLIWGHGIKNQKEILKLIALDDDFEIKLILKKHIKNIKKFVKLVYKYDYVPYHHLKSKTEYLLNSPKEVIFIFVKNKKPQEVWKLGHGTGHVESEKISTYKNIIRDKYNSRQNNRRTENHVIHASDNEAQAHHMLKFLGYKEGIYQFDRHQDKPFNVPHFIDCFNKYRLRRVKARNLICNIISSNGGLEQVSIKDTPQYNFLLGCQEEYDNYIEKNKGVGLKAFYDLESYLNMSQGFRYLEEGFERDYIIVRKIQKKYLVLDGLHRASILLNQDQDVINVMEIIE